MVFTSQNIKLLNKLLPYSLNRINSNVLNLSGPMNYAQ